MSRIVVGVDGSEHSLVALRWALREATFRQATVDAVYAWHAPAWFMAEGFTRSEFTAFGRELEEQAGSILRALVQQVATPFLQVRIEEIVVNDRPAKALLDIAGGADLLVVGSRGRGGFKGLLLGSVSAQCVAHAPCPVVVVPSTP